MKTLNLLKAMFLFAGLSFATASCTNSEEPNAENRYVRNGYVVDKVVVMAGDTPVYYVHFFDGRKTYRIIVNKEKYDYFKVGMIAYGDISNGQNFAEGDK